MAVQKRENDLVLGTFGRGFYVLDDYSRAARDARADAAPRTRSLYPLRDAYIFNQTGMAPAGTAGIGPMAGNWTAPNPPFGAVFTYSVNAGPAGGREAGADDQPTTPASRCAGWISTRRRACGASRGTCAAIRRRRARPRRQAGRRRLRRRPRRQPGPARGAGPLSRDAGPPRRRQGHAGRVRPRASRCCRLN